MKNVSQLTKILGIFALVVLLAACAMFDGRETVGQYVDDTTITSKAKAEILGEPSLKVLQINVETMQGIVQLSGFVDTTQSETKAIDIVNRIHGVKGIKNDLVVRSKQRTK